MYISMETYFQAPFEKMNFATYQLPASGPESTEYAAVAVVEEVFLKLEMLMMAACLPDGR